MHKLRSSTHFWWLWLVVVVLAGSLTVTAVDLALVVSDTRIPPECSTDSTFPILAAVHDDPDQETEAVFLFCDGHILQYSLHTDEIGRAASFYSGSTYATAVGVGRGQVVSIEAERYQDQSSIFYHHTSNLEATEFVGSLLNNLYYGVTLWNHNDDVYVFGASIDGYTGIERWSVTDRHAYPVGNLPGPRTQASGVWVPDQNRAYIFGGFDAIADERSIEILSYDPETEGVTRFGSLPVPVHHSCAVWTGRVAYIICGNEQQPEYNFIRFDPYANEVEPEQVRDFNFPCTAAVCSYSERLNRVYVFGGYGNGNASDLIMYIDLDGVTTVDPVSSTTPEVGDPSTTDTYMYTTEEDTTTTTGTEGTTTTTTTSTTGAPGRGCSALDKYGVRYEASVGANATRPCPGQSRGTATWFCQAENIFEGPNPNYRQCTSLWLEEVKEIIDAGQPINSTKAWELLHTVRQHILLAIDASAATNVTYFGHEIRTLFQIGEGVLALVENSTQVETVEQLTEDMFEIFDRVLLFASPWNELSQRERAETGTTFILTSDGSAIGLAYRHNDGQDLPLPYRKEFEARPQFRILSGSELVTNRKQGITFPDEHNTKTDSYIEIPPEWDDHFPDEKYISFSGVRLSHDNVSYLFPPPPSLPASGEFLEAEMESASRKIINGPLMAFTFGGSNFQSLHSRTRLNFTGEGVLITFQHEVPAWGPERAQIRRRLHDGEDPKAVLGSGICVYWDETQLNWSTEGCRLASSTLDTTVCECNHLTAFGIIFDLHEYIGKTLVLEIMTWVLCSASIICLGLTIAVFVYSRVKRQLFTKHPRNDLTLNMSISLLVANVLILTTMDKHYLHLSDAACTASAIGLHYSLTCAFSWMALEGILLAKLVFLDVFGSGRENAKLERVGAYAVPALVVGATCAVNFGLGDHGYGNDAYCWLHGRYMWSFIGIVAAVVIFNTTVLVMALRKSSRLNTNPRVKVVRQVATAKAASFWIRGALSLTIVMGITWTSGFLMLIDNPTVAHIAAYIFTASSASQGVFIFLLHVVSSKQFRSRFKRVAGCIGGHSNGTTTGEHGNRGWRSTGTGLDANGHGRRRTTTTSANANFTNANNPKRRGTFATLYS